MKAFNLAESLVASGMLTAVQLQKAEVARAKSAESLYRYIVTSNLVPEAKLQHWAAEQLGVPAIELKTYQIDHAVARQLSENLSRRYKVLILQEDDKGFLLAMAEPLEPSAVSTLSNILQQPLHFALSRQVELLGMMDLVYRRTADITHFAQKLDAEIDKQHNDSELIEGDNAPVIKLIHSLFEDALQVNASDIHIEPGEHVLRIRLRVDGVLQEQIMDNKAIAPSIMLRLKLMSGLNISEKRLPQDGRFNIKVRNQSVDVRLSTLPTQYGESAVMRLLRQDISIKGLDHIGMPDEIVERLRRLLSRPHGIVLVTGPTGSGKTTTLYSGLFELNKPGKKIITVEDPVEYRLDRIVQVQTHAKVGLDFAQVLRTVLRQDPNIVMLGEMRDQETATIAIRAALTGHLVLSTLHTNDSASSALRLVDMGVQGYLVAATLRGVLAQRLVRLVCKGCAEPYTPDEAEKSWLINVLGEERTATLKLVRGKGCNLCSGSGFKGRRGVYELLELDAELIDALRSNDTIRFYHHAAEVLKGKLLMNGALELAEQGLTVLSEVFRVAGET